MKRSKTWLRLLAAAAAAVLMCCAGCDRPAGKIDFTQTQPQTAPAADGVVCPAPAHRLRLGHVA